MFIDGTFMLKLIRRIFATVTAVGLTLLLLDISGALAGWSWLAKLQFLPALLSLNLVVVALLVGLTLLFGRIYCSVICPLGVLQDLIAHVGRTGRRNPYSYSRAHNIVRYVVLAVFVAAMAAGIGSIPALLAPYSSYARMVTMLLQPLYTMANNGLATVAEGMGSYAFREHEVWMRGLPTFVVALSTLLVIGVLAWRDGRTYCNTICPVGTVLGQLARAAWLKVWFDAEKCKKCGACSRNCKASCLDFKEGKVDYSRCVVCGNCLEKCNFGALHYGHPEKKTTTQKLETNTEGQTVKKEAKGNPDMGRRTFLTGIGAAMATAGMAQTIKKVDGGLTVIEDKREPARSTRIVPPGARSLRNFASRCTGCQLCVSKCPNGVLRPSGDLLTMMQPVMSYERGYCRPECTACSEVCPTGAIVRIDRAEKSSIQIGHAVWRKEGCVVLTDSVECGNCARHCPTGAISMVDFERMDGSKTKIPAVDEAKCIGCGECEYLCPARPLAAIYVEGHEMHRFI